MPIFKHYDAECNVLYEAGSGVVTLAELVAHRNSLLSLPIRSGIRCFAEYSRAKVDLDYQQMLSLVEPTKEVVGDKEFKVAIHTEDDHGFGIARMYETIHTDDQYDAEVFRSFGEACKWLDLPVNETQQLFERLMS